MTLKSTKAIWYRHAQRKNILYSKSECTIEVVKMATITRPLD